MLGLSVCFWNYDRTMPMVDGRVVIDGCDPRYVILRPEDAFARAFSSAEFDVTELSLSNYMTALADGRSAYVAIPVFPSRTFRHASIFVRRDRGIREPRDLVGRTIGLQEYQMTAALVVRGLLRDEYGIQSSDLRWRVGDVEEVGGHIPQVPDVTGVDICAVEPGRTLDGMLSDGALDAMIALLPPPCFLRRVPGVERLFADWRSAEKAYFRKTGVFPIMHTVGIRKTLLERHSWLAHAVFQAFQEAKDAAIEELGILQAPKVTLPWAAAELEETRRLMGEDFWPYGLAANRKTLESLIRYSFEEGLSSRHLTVEELFTNETLDT